MALERDPVAQEWVVFRDLTGAGRSADVLALADRIIAESTDPPRIAQALIEKLVALVNMGQAEHTGPLLDEITVALRDAPVPRLVGEFHVMAGDVAYNHGSFSVAVTHLVHAERALRKMTEINLAAADSWHDLSVTFSLLRASTSRRWRRCGKGGGCAARRRDPGLHVRLYGNPCAVGRCARSARLYGYVYS